MTNERTTVDYSRLDRIVFMALSAVIGGLIGWFGPMLADSFLGDFHAVRWLLNLLDWLAGLAGGSGRWFLLAGLALLGALAGWGLSSHPDTVTVADDAFWVHSEKDTTRWARAQVHDVVLEKRPLDSCLISVRDAQDADLQRADLDFPVDRVADALRTHDWPVRVEARPG